MTCHSIKNTLRIGLLGFFFLCSLSVTVRADTFFGESPTGFLELDDFKHPVYLIVPDQYKPTRPLPLVLAIMGEGMKLKEYAEEWVTISKRKSMIVIVPSVLVSDSDVPYRADEWLMKIKSDVRKRYRIAKDRMYLVGTGTGAHYAAYLGMNYPEEFSGVGLMGNSWAGPLEKILKVEKHPSDQTPFFVAFSEKDKDKLAPAQTLADEFTGKGYPIHIEVLEADEDYTKLSFKKRMFKWLDDKSESWKIVVRESNQSLKHKISKWFRRNVSPK